MNLFYLVVLGFIYYSTFLFAVIFFQLPYTDYSTTGCDSQDGIDTIKSTLNLYRSALLISIIGLCLVILIPLGSVIFNIVLKVTTGVAGSITTIVIGIIQILIVLAIVIFMSVLYVNIGQALDLACSNKTGLIEKLDYVYSLSKTTFFISIILSVIITIGLVGSYLYERKKKKDLEKYYQDYADYVAEVEEENAQAEEAEQRAEAAEIKAEQKAEREELRKARIAQQLEEEKNARIALQQAAKQEEKQQQAMQQLSQQLIPL